MSKRVLLTGATGFIGRHAIEQLVARGYEVVALHARALPDATERAHEGSPVRWLRGDLLASGGAARVVREANATHLLHLAWYAEHRKFWTAVENLAWVEASLALARGFHQAGGTRIVCAGTCAEYDWAHGLCIEGVTPTNPETLYGVSKDALRRVLESYAKTHALSWAWGRVFFLHGPGEHPDRFVASVCRALVRGEEARCTHGRQVRDLMHAYDVAGALVALLDAGTVHGAVNVGSGEPHTLGDAARLLAKEAGQEGLLRIGAIEAPAKEPAWLLADARRLQDEVRFVAKYGFEEGLKATLEAWRGEHLYRSVSSDRMQRSGARHA